MYLSFLISAIVLCLASALDDATVTDIRNQIRQLIDDDAVDRGDADDRRFLAGFVRLAFHDCVGDRCDGCINSNNPENAGLDIYITGLEGLYSALEVNGQSVNISRADFWMVAGIEAVYYSAERASGNYSPSLTFSTGRVDCASSPSTDESHDFPSAIGDTAHILEFFEREFGFDAKEATAILGAHTLGSAHPDASGFIHPWVPRKDQLDNDFYVALGDANKGWSQRSIGPQNNLQWFWESTGNRKQLMLNADMALIRNLSSMTDDGMVSCTYSTCPVANTLTVDWVAAFAADNNLWIDEFSKAFQKMIEKGWDGQLTALGSGSSTSTAMGSTASSSTSGTTASSSTSGTTASSSTSGTTASSSTSGTTARSSTSGTTASSSTSGTTDNLSKSTVADNSATSNILLSCSMFVHVLLVSILFFSL